KGNTEDEGVEVPQRRKAVKLPLVKQHRDNVGGYQGRNHGARDHPARFRLADQPDSEVSRQKDEGKTERPPSAMKTEEINRNLHQVIAGDDDEDVESNQQAEIERHPRLRD